MLKSFYTSLLLRPCRKHGHLCLGLRAEAPLFLHSHPIHAPLGRGCFLLLHRTSCLAFCSPCRQNSPLLFQGEHLFSGGFRHDKFRNQLADAVPFGYFGSYIGARARAYFYCYYRHVFPFHLWHKCVLRRL